MNDDEAVEAYRRYWLKHGRYWGQQEGERVQFIIEGAIKNAFYSGVRIANYHKNDARKSNHNTGCRIKGKIRQCEFDCPVSKKKTVKKER